MSNPDIDFSQIWTDRITPQIRKHLQTAVDACYYGYTVDDVIGWVHAHDMQLWHGTGKGIDFIVLTQMFVHPKGTELHVWSLAGKGFYKSAKYAHSVLIEFGKKYNCIWLTGYENEERLARLYSFLKPKTIFRKWIMEI